MISSSPSWRAERLLSNLYLRDALVSDSDCVPAVFKKRNAIKAPIMRTRNGRGARRRPAPRNLPWNPCICSSRRAGMTSAKALLWSNIHTTTHHHERRPGRDRQHAAGIAGQAALAHGLANRIAAVMEIIKRSTRHKFEVIPKRWIVAPSLA